MAFIKIGGLSFDSFEELFEYKRTHPEWDAGGNNIIDRDNSALLTKAKSAWSANPNQEGATLASKYLADIIVNSKSVKAEIDKLSNEIKSRLREIDNNAINLRKTEILSRERIEIENIRAAEKKTSAFYGMLPKLAYNIIRWL